MAATSKSDVQLVLLPSDEPSIAPYVQPYKHFRLAALLLAPDAFASTYSREIAFSDSLWKSRLLSPLANVFIAQHATPSHTLRSPEKETPETNILCTLALLGPLTIPPAVLEAATNPWTVLASADQLLEDAVRPWHFRFASLFTLPEARGMGLAKDLISMAVKFARDFAQEKTIGEDSGEFVVSIAVEEDNIAARVLYEKCGFVGIG